MSSTSGDGHTTTVDTVEGCIEDMGILKGLECDLTMGQLVVCQASMAADMCAGFALMESPECTPVYADCLFKAMEQQMNQ